MEQWSSVEECGGEQFSFSGRCAISTLCLRAPSFCWIAINNHSFGTSVIPKRGDGGGATTIMIANTNMEMNLDKSSHIIVRMTLIQKLEREEEKEEKEGELSLLVWCSVQLFTTDYVQNQSFLSNTNGNTNGLLSP